MAEGTRQPVQRPPREPIALRIVITEEHRWLKVENHLSICPGNGCSVDICLYIRQLCSHDLHNCTDDCAWCTKVQSWVKYHSPHCGPKKCPYYKICHETQKKFFKSNISRRLISDQGRERSPSSTSECSSSSITSEQRTQPHLGGGASPDSNCTVHETANCCDGGGCCHDPVSPQPILEYMKGTFSDKLEEIYQRALEEELPVSDIKIKDLIETRLQLRLALLHRHRFYQEGRHWVRIKQLGCGGSATTFCIKDLESAFWLALKEEQETDNTVDETYISLHLSSIAKHHPPNIVEFYGASLLPSTADRTLQLFLELMPCCLQSYLFNGGPLSIEDCHNYACQLFDALDFLHRTINLVHSDIKPGNLLIDENIQRLKVADFGCAQILEDSHQGYCMRGDAKAGTVHYNPPEHFKEYRCSYGLDVWQAGCCLISMVTGRRPWRSLYCDCKTRQLRAEAQLYQSQMIATVTYSHMVPGCLDTAMRELVTRCVQLDYCRRPSTQDCLRLLVQSDVVSDDRKSQWLSQLGFQPTCFSSSFSSISPVIDVYLGSYFHYAHYSMLPGWLGSVSCDSHMTYSQLLPVIFSAIPITHQFGMVEIALCDNSPRLIWQKSQLDPSSQYNLTSMDIYHLPRPTGDTPIDTTKAVILIVQ